MKKMLSSVLLTALAFFGFVSSAAASGVSRPWQLNFQEPASPVMEMIENFHNELLYIIFAVAAFVLILMTYILIRFRAGANPVPSKTSHNTLLEVVWTVVPIVILVVIVVPSMRLIYFMDKTAEAEMTLKVTGYQWYWGYEYPDNGGIAFESHLIPDEEIKDGQYRLLETDNRVVLPVGTNIRILVTSADVLHAWAIPAFGVKSDATPGKLNETWVRIEKEGVYYGQCSELCGTGHGFMPIAVEAVSKEKFDAWVRKQKSGA